MGDEMNDRIRDYASGKQDIEKYKKLVTGSQVSDNWRQINWGMDKKFFNLYTRTLWIKLGLWKTKQGYQMVNRLKSIS